MLDRMNASRIRELLTPFSVGVELTDVHVAQLSTYLELLLKWNSRMNLTSVREPDQIVRRHFGESLFAASLVASDCALAKSLMDVGSGAGFPGIPIKIVMPHLQLTLIEAQQKKATFLREVVRALNLADVQVANTRADQFGLIADAVTLRAVESFERILPVAERLVAAQGTMVLLIGASQAEKAKSLLPGFQWKEAHAVPLSERCVVLSGSRN
jgi:16S rRNA (guanine527-N7)-methyltransferase